MAKGQLCGGCGWSLAMWDELTTNVQARPLAACGTSRAWKNVYGGEAGERQGAML